MKRYVFEVVENGETYGFDAELSEELGQRLMERRTLVVSCEGTLENKGPAWVFDAGLGKVWCFFQDIFNFRNPWRRS